LIIDNPFAPHADLALPKSMAAFVRRTVEQALVGLRR